MFFHRLQFRSKGAFTGAVSRLLRSPLVEDCIVDVDKLTVDFSAPAGETSRLINQIHKGPELPEWSFFQATA